MKFIEILNVLTDITNRQEISIWIQKHNPISSDLKSQALLSYINDWLQLTPENQTFDFKQFLSDDHSSIMYGRCPIIFLGTNDWATKRFYSEESLNIEMKKWRHHLNSMLDKSTAPIYCCIIPEKDTVLRSFLNPENPISPIDSYTKHLMSGFKNRIAGYSDLTSIQATPDKNILNYEYYDSHLLSRDYLGIFFSTLQGLNLINDIDIDRIKLKPEPHIGDLSKKLRSTSRPSSYLALSYANESAQLISGNESFNTPLRKTQQSFKCNTPMIDAKVTIYGDSHSSIYQQKKLTYLFANTFKRCDFLWDPFCINNQKPMDDSDFIIFEISQRFMT